MWLLTLLILKILLGIYGIYMLYTVDYKVAMGFLFTLNMYIGGKDDEIYRIREYFKEKRRLKEIKREREERISLTVDPSMYNWEVFMSETKIKIGDVVIAKDDYMGNNTKGKMGIVKKTEYENPIHPYYVVFNETLNKNNYNDNDWFMPEHLLEICYGGEY